MKILHGIEYEIEGLNQDISYYLTIISSNLE